MAVLSRCGLDGVLRRRVHPGAAPDGRYRPPCRRRHPPPSRRASDLLLGRDAPGGGDAPRRRRADGLDRCSIRPLHQPFGVDVRVEELAAERLQRPHRRRPASAPGRSASHGSTTRPPRASTAAISLSCAERVRQARAEVEVRRVARKSADPTMTFRAPRVEQGSCARPTIARRRRRGRAAACRRSRPASRCRPSPLAASRSINWTLGNALEPADPALEIVAWRWRAVRPGPAGRHGRPEDRWKESA